MQFQYFTYFLNPVTQTPLFSDGRDKKSILNEILTRREEIEFESHGSRLAYVFVKQEENYILGKLGRRSSLRRNLSPQKKFEETYEENWPFCFVVINTDTNSQSGQKIAFEFKTNVFRDPNQQLKSFSDQLNTYLFPKGYAISINAVTTDQEFWETIRNNENKIQQVSFSFNAPNLFDLDNSLNEDLKKLQQEYSLTRATIELENPDGKLKVPQNSFTKQGVEYIAKGGGEYKIKLKGRKKVVIRSKKNIKTENFDGIELFLEAEDQQSIFPILERIFNLFR